MPRNGLSRVRGSLARSRLPGRISHLEFVSSRCQWRPTPQREYIRSKLEVFGGEGLVTLSFESVSHGGE